SKSFKLYLGSFRNVGAFHEDCTVAIGKKLVGLLTPKFLRIGGYWYPRGGMPIDVFWQTGKLPANVWLPDQGVAPYPVLGRAAATIASSALTSWPGSTARMMLPMTAMPIGPDASTSAALVALSPPMARTGTGAARAISASPLWPISGP